MRLLELFWSAVKLFLDMTEILVRSSILSLFTRPSSSVISSFFWASLSPFLQVMDSSLCLVKSLLCLAQLSFDLLKPLFSVIVLLLELIMLIVPCHEFFDDRLNVFSDLLMM